MDFSINEWNLFVIFFLISKGIQFYYRFGWKDFWFVRLVSKPALYKFSHSKSFAQFPVQIPLDCSPNKKRTYEWDKSDAREEVARLSQNSSLMTSMHKSADKIHEAATVTVKYGHVINGSVCGPSRQSKIFSSGTSAGFGFKWNP